MRESCWTDSVIPSQPDTDGLWWLPTNVDEGLTGFVPLVGLVRPRSPVRARADRIAGGDPAGSIEVCLADGTLASKGDEVITRRNDQLPYYEMGRRAMESLLDGDLHKGTQLLPMPLMRRDSLLS